MFCCAEMRCWRNDVCTMRKMMCRCAAMEGESSQGELLQNCKRPRPLSLLTAFAASSPEGGAFRHLPVSRVKPPPFGGGGIAQR